MKHILSKNCQYSITMKRKKSALSSGCKYPSCLIDGICCFDKCPDDLDDEFIPEDHVEWDFPESENIAEENDAIDFDDL